MVLAAFEMGMVLVIVVVAALPIAAIAFAMGAGRRFDEIGKGDFAMEHDQPAGPRAVAPVSAEVREEEIRQMVQARSDRGVAKGRNALDVEAEVERLLAPERSGSLAGDSELRDEVRQLVVARNERRQRQGKEPLDVDEETDRQLRELENLGQ